jgi:hypothetical protein
MCSYKRLSELYWNSTTNVNAAIPDNNADIITIVRTAMNDRPAEFGPHVALGDPGAFYEWVVGQFRWSGPVGGFTPREKKNARWNLEHDAIFDTDFHEEILCLTCDRRSQNNGNRPMIELDGTTPDSTLDETLHRRFFEI